ncbi:MAG: hypothetical protein AAFX05_06460 [Planctomycetota bacterium]
MGHRIAATVMLAVTLTMLSGCVITSRSSDTVTGRQIGEQTLALLESEVTTEEQMLELLGAPTRSVAADGGGMIYIYEYERTRSSRGALFLVFSGKTQKTERQAVSIMVRDGVVQTWWAEGAGAA